MRWKNFLVNQNLFYFVLLSRLVSFNSASVGNDNSQIGNVKYLKTDDGYLVENNMLQTSEQDVHLEDFFWTGSGDGPGPVRPISGPPIQNTIVRTATILATVYLDGNFESDFDPLCIFDCDKNGGNNGGGSVNSFDKIPPTDRRYWLLTVVAGLFRDDDFPILEEKLAKLYRVAFLRQQARHLGIINGNKTHFNYSHDESVTRKKRFNEDNNLKSWKPSSTDTIKTRNILINRNVYEHERILLKMPKNRIKRDNNKFIKKEHEIMSGKQLSEKIQKYHETKSYQKVSVLIHNLTVVTSDDDKDLSLVVKNDLNPQDENKAAYANQTEIIYTVFVGRAPVLAHAAAQDMRLVTNEEGEKIMEKLIVLKAEPYLKEPQATPLVPSVHSNLSTFNSIFEQHPIIIIIMCSTIILLAFLLIMFLLFGRSKKQKMKAESKRISATQALVKKINVDEDINPIRSEESSYNEHDIGVDNLAFEKESKLKQGQHNNNKSKHLKTPPTLHFPLPPVNRPSSCSSSSTSDSSVYYPKRRGKHENIQDLLTAKSHYAKDSPDDEDEFYTKVLKSSYKSSLNEPKNPKKYKRKYKENKVSSIEHIDVHSPQLSSYLSDKRSEYQGKSSPFSPTISPSQYHRNVILADEKFKDVHNVENENTRNECFHTDMEYREKSVPQAIEAINKELINNVQQQRLDKTCDSVSIGSFLSMASIKSFPRYSMPESLAKVLEPVSVTHLDHSDPDYDTLNKNYRISASQKSIEIDDDNEHEFDEKLSRTQSDGADPGVLGPIVWEMHKKELTAKTSNDVCSPIRDPFVTRNRFEGLLEGAMKLYGSNSYSNCHSIMNQDEEINEENLMPGVIKSIENRGKSAATIRLTSRTSGILSRNEFKDHRPKTAASSSDYKNSRDPPFEKSKAWHSGSGTPLVRPLSREVTHPSPSPIIDAIQNELSKFSKEAK